MLVASILACYMFTFINYFRKNIEFNEFAEFSSAENDYEMREMQTDIDEQRAIS